MAKTELKIRIYGDPALSRKSQAVKEVTPRHREILSSMAQLMYAGEGIGLAAPQVGINETMIVVDIGNSSLYKLINPRIIKISGSQTNQEGCLSIPGVCVKVKRANKVTVIALDQDAKEVTIKAEGLLACVLQHEIDHLKGKTIVDYASIFVKLRLKKTLKELTKQSKAKTCQLL